MNRTTEDGNRRKKEGVLLYVPFPKIMKIARIM